MGIDPLPCGEILRAVFIEMIYLKVWRHFEGGDNSRKYGTLFDMCMAYVCGGDQ